ncbi:hypothetical protein PTE30175_03663 [Pandoraea terrae]|uniref:DUF305 domain-containing protein n=1 Tax=Pandoraea terrae TaxID=1537710 RepID=A0A5E4XA93_9BURK|nr:hypothetical protein [Pandoraea terrae]VVE33125.1 hypothetical protein PTE30175_03663 [Pandoraea terrae]
MTLISKNMGRHLMLGVCLGAIHASLAHAESTVAYAMSGDIFKATKAITADERELLAMARLLRGEERYLAEDILAQADAIDQAGKSASTMLWLVSEGHGDPTSTQLRIIGGELAFLDQHIDLSLQAVHEDQRVVQTPALAAGAERLKTDATELLSRIRRAEKAFPKRD